MKKTDIRQKAVYASGKKTEGFVSLKIDYAFASVMKTACPQEKNTGI